MGVRKQGRNMHRKMNRLNNERELSQNFGFLASAAVSGHPELKMLEETG